MTAVHAQIHLCLLCPMLWDRGCFGSVGPHLNQTPGKAMHWPASAAWPTQLNDEEKMLGQQQQACLPAKDSFDPFAAHANQSVMPWRWGMMDVAIPSTSRSAFSFHFSFFNLIFLISILYLQFVSLETICTALDSCTDYVRPDSSWNSTQCNVEPSPKH